MHVDVINQAQYRLFLKYLAFPGQHEASAFRGHGHREKKSDVG